MSCALGGAGSRPRASSARASLGTQHSHTTGKLKAMQDSPDYEVAGICENDPEAKARAQKDPRFQGLRWMTEEELLRDPPIHLIVVECSVWEALPMGHESHRRRQAPAPRKASRQYTGSRSRSWWRRHGDKKLLLQTGYVWRWHEGVNAALDAARKGWLGDVFMVRGTMNSDRDAEQRAVEAKYRGGGMFELSGHVIDRIVELLGRPKKVQSWLRHDTSFPDKLADNNLAVLEYRQGAGGDRAIGANGRLRRPSLLRGDRHRRHDHGLAGIVAAENAGPHAQAAGLLQSGLAGYHSAAAAALRRRFQGTGAGDQERTAAEAFLRS